MLLTSSARHAWRAFTPAMVLTIPLTVVTLLTRDLFFVQIAAAPLAVSTLRWLWWRHVLAHNSAHDDGTHLLWRNRRRLRGQIAWTQLQKVEMGRWAKHPQWSLGGRAPATAHTYLTLFHQPSASWKGSDGVSYVTDLLLLDEDEQAEAIQAVQRACAEHGTPFTSLMAPKTAPATSASRRSSSRYRGRR